MPISHSAAPPVVDEPFAILVEDLIEHIENGEQLDMDAVMQQHPQHAEQLRTMWPAIEAMFQLAQSGGTHARDFIDPVTADGDEQVIRFGDYEIVSEIGRGGMGVVYRARERTLHRDVALKVLPLAALADRRQLARFHNEARAAAALHHSHIVPIFAVGVEQGTQYYAMQYVEGPTLAQVVSELRRREKRSPEPPRDPAGPVVREGESTNGRRAPSSHASDDNVRKLQVSIATLRSSSVSEYCRTVARWAIQVADALAHAHEHGVLHRDIKPSNLLLDASSNVWIADFGLARLEGSSTATATGDLVGTLRFMSPERLTGNGRLVDERSDVYSLGVTLYELLTLQSPFQGDTRAEIRDLIESAEPRPLRKIEPKIAVDLETVVLTAMAGRPQDRYATGTELVKDLRRYLRNEPILAKRPSRWQRASKWARRHRSALSAVVASASLLLILGAVFAARLYQQESRHDELTNQNLQLAMQTLDEMYLDVVGDRLIPQSFGSQYGQHALVLTDPERELLDKALIFYEQFAQQNRDNPFTLAHLGMAYLRIGDIHGNLLQLPQAEKAYRQAEEVFHRLIDQHPTGHEHQRNLALSHLKRGSVLVQLQNWREAETVLLESEQLLQNVQSFGAGADDVSLATVNHALAAAFAGQERLVEAEDRYRSALAHWDLHFAGQAAPEPRTETLEICEWLGKRYIETDQFEEVKRLLEDWDRHVPPGEEHIDTGSRACQAFLLAKVGWYDKAFRAQQQAFGSRFFWGDYVRRFTTFDWLTPETLLPYLDRAIDVDPKDSSLRLTRASVHRALGNYDQSLADLNRAGELSPDSAACFIGRGLLQKELGDHPRALEEWEAAIEHEPLQFLAYFLRATLYADLDEEVLARREIDRIVQLSNSNAELQNRIAWFLVTCQPLRMRAPTIAVELAMKATAQEPGERNYWNTLGVAQYRAGAFDDSVKSLGKALDLSDDAPAIDLLPLALAHWKLGEEEPADRYYRIGLQAFQAMSPNQIDYPELAEFQAEMEHLMATRGNSRTQRELQTSASKE